MFRGKKFCGKAVARRPAECIYNEGKKGRGGGKLSVKEPLIGKSPEILAAQGLMDIPKHAMHCKPESCRKGRGPVAVRPISTKRHGEI